MTLRTLYASTLLSHTFQNLMCISQEQSDAERSEPGSEVAEEDYDVDEEYDNDYAENYFDNGEGDEDDTGGGVGDEGGGGECPYFYSSLATEFLRTDYD